MNQKEKAGRLGFLDSLGRLFRAEEAQEQAPTASEETGRFGRLEAEFETALRGLTEKIEEQRAQSGAPGAGPRGRSAEDVAAERQRRMQDCHRAIREDIDAMHARLGTGLSAAELDAIGGLLRDLDAVATEGKDSHALLPRVRFAIARKLQDEAGELAVTRLVALLERAKLEWPDPTRYRPGAEPEEIERSRRRRLAEVRESFLAQNFARTAERAVGIVRAWGGDYPDRGSPLWEESVLEGVAAGLRGALLKEFVEVLRRDRELLFSRTEASIGKELAALQSAVAGGVRSIEQANAAIASSLGAIDEVVPKIAWEHLCAQLPRARGEFAT
jgi:hypothetical protein